jgi:short-subunit dehydrogenase
MARRWNLSGMRMLVTGASQGIGKSLAFAAAQRGAKLVLVARNAELLDEIAAVIRSNGTDVLTVPADVAKPADRRRMLDQAVDRFGGLDILVNNAGIGATGHFCEAEEDRLRKIMEVNFFAVTETVRLAVPILRQSPQPMIVNVSSILGKRAWPGRSEYSASKFALEGFTQALRAELARFDIHVLNVCPGLTATNFSQNMLEQKARVQMDHMRSMTPDQVAEAAIRAIEKGKNEILLTFKGRLLVFVNRFLPKLVDRIMAKRVRQTYADELTLAASRTAARSGEREMASGAR